MMVGSCGVGSGFAGSPRDSGFEGSHCESFSSLGKFSNVETETLTPESSAGGRPSRASVFSVVDTVTPSSLHSRASLQSRTDSVFAKASATSTPASFVPHAREPQRPRGLQPGPVRLCPSEQRRRKYTIDREEPAHRRADDNSPPLVHQAQSSSSTARATSSASSVDDREVLIEGPLEQRVLFFFWRSRWCVLDRQVLRIYSDERAAMLSLELTLECHDVNSFQVASEVHTPSVLSLSDVLDACGVDGEPFLFLRTGPGGRWEELAASALWQRAFRVAQQLNATAGLVATVPKPLLPHEDDAAGTSESGGIVSKPASTDCASDRLRA